MSSETALDRLRANVEKTVKKKVYRALTIGNIQEAVADLSFIHEGLKLNDADPSYELRLDRAAKFWRLKATDHLREKQHLDGDQIDDITLQLQARLKNKEYQYVEDDSLPRGNTEVRKKHENSRRVLAYVTTISEHRIFVKPDNNGDELEVTKQEIPFSSIELDAFLNPGDEVYVETCGSRRGGSLRIIKCSECSDEREEEFIRALMGKLSSKETDALVIFIEVFESCKGIWDYIKSDKKFHEMKDENLKNFLKICKQLAERLQDESKTNCTKFLDDVSSSSFFVKFLPDFIEKTGIDLDSNETRNIIETLLILIAKYSPSAAKRVLNVASSLAKTLVNKENSDVDETHTHKNYLWGINLLTNIGKSLAKSIPGSKEVDPANSAWYELPTILAQKEIFEECHITSLLPIKRSGRYKNVEEYLETYHNLLREECYRDLHAGIRNFYQNPKDHDPTQMNMYRIKLDKIDLASSDVSIKLSYELYGQENDESLQNKTVLYGNLMCISLDKKFKQLIWATVAGHPKEKPENSNHRFVYVKLCSKRNELEDGKVLVNLNQLTKKGDYALMAESPSFFNAFGPSIKHLKKAHKNPDEIPFKEEIINCEKSKPPEYTQENNQNCDWSVIFEKQKGCNFQVSDDSSPIDQFKTLRENKVKSELDETQLDAIQTFLKNRLTLIQGPPGTGKSFLGVKILRLLLSMKTKNRNGPILVMTYKNYALDHFMQMCLEYCPNTVRIGRSNENTLKEVKEINMKNICKAKKMRNDLHHSDKSAMSKINQLRPKIKKSLENLMKPRFTLDLFLQAAEEHHVDSLLSGPSGSSMENRDKTCEDDEDKIKRDLIKNKLLEWLPEKKLTEKYRNFSKCKEAKPRYGNVFKESSKENSDDSVEAVDQKAVINERLQNAADEWMDKEYMSEDSNSDIGCDGEINVPLAYLFQKDDRSELAKLREVDNVWELSDEDRVDFIYELYGKVMTDNITTLTTLLKEYEQSCEVRNDISVKHQIDVLKKYDVIGMTISGAAIRSKLLRHIEPRAVIIEEAAEILEGQLTSVLPKSIEHLVMLGDQEQLKPSVSCYDLKRHKNLDCSMFERLINNKLNYQQLGRQCRMRDDIAQLLRELNIYKDFKTNAEKTRDNHPPKSIGKSMFFWNHTVPEKKASGTSKYNAAEIRKITEVASHMLKYDYSPDNITVLCAYRSQVERMSHSFLQKSKELEHESYTKLKNIKITTVDSFQGEENKVILLSLVRSGEGKLGFMAEKNRICVAMSRAQCGLYIFGNASHFEEYSRNWKKILNHLREKRLFGSNFELKEISEKDEQQLDEKPMTINIAHANIQIGNNNKMNVNKSNTDDKGDNP